MWPKQDVQILQRAYDGLPGTKDEKVRFLAVLLRIRIEGVVLSVPSTVLVVNTYPSRVRHKLLASVGDVSLSQAQQVHRLDVVRRGSWTYEVLCDFLHARGTLLHPPVEEMTLWQENVEELEREFDLGVAVSDL